MKKLLITIGVVVVLAMIYFYVGHVHCNFYSTTMEIKNYTDICKAIAGWY